MRIQACGCVSELIHSTQSLKQIDAETCILSTISVSEIYCPSRYKPGVFTVDCTEIEDSSPF